MQHIDRLIACKHGRQPIEYPHPSIAHLLDTTYGVIVYQDQVMLTAQDFAGYTLGEADILRKAMGKKVPAIMREEERKFVEGAVKKGHTEQEGRDLFTYILPFAGYGFNKAHAVSYAYITYWTTYFKANYPLEYFVAMLDSFAGAPERVQRCISEAKRRGIEVLPPDINISKTSFTVDEGVGERGGIRYGLASIQGNRGHRRLRRLWRSRDGDGKGVFDDVADFCDRLAEAAPPESSLRLLIKAGAFDSMAQREQLLDQADSLCDAYAEDRCGALVGTAFDVRRCGFQRVIYRYRVRSAAGEWRSGCQDVEGVGEGAFRIGHHREPGGC